MSQKVKSQKRLDFMELISEAITQEDIFNTINYKHKSEDQIKQFIYPHLVQSLTEYLEKNGVAKDKAKDSVKRNLKWEGNINTTVHHTLFMGTLNRPDMVLEMNGVKIAIEFKKGESGSSLRSGIGQSIIYSTNYDFVMYLFIDTSKDERIKNAQSSLKEAKLMQDLWNRYNIKFVVA
tara:strand:- start:144 stop:677 length:534 start_codon:yes stop_codon:yes gene_type:complete